MNPFSLCSRHLSDSRSVNVCNCGSSLSYDEYLENLAVCSICGSVTQTFRTEMPDQKRNRLTFQAIEDAKRILGDVPDDKIFYTCDGITIRNLDEAASYLKKADDNSFQHHVNCDRNDFYNWIRDVHQDDALASNLRKHKRRSALYKTLKNRIKILKRRLC